jgi:hypothetical protein
MDPSRFARLEQVFHRASEASGEARERMLAEACGDDLDLRREVEELLAAASREASPLDRPAAANFGAAKIPPA